VLPFGGLEGTAPVFMVIGTIIAALWLPALEAVLVGAVYLAQVAVLATVPELEQVPTLFPPEYMPRALFVGNVIAMMQAAVIVGITVDALSAASVEAQLRTTQAQRAQQKALKASEAKSAFLAMMSHELRTPLNAILGYAQLLREDAGPGDSDLERIERSGSKLLNLVDDVLEMARAESTRLGSFEAVDLRALVEEQIAALDAVACVSAPSGPVIVVSERPNLRRIVSNLLSHSARSSRARKLEVTLSEDVQLAYLSIHNRGHTIPKAMLPEMFEPFGRLERGAGTGLGLALAQRLAHRLGGSIEVATTEKEGSTFTLRLPKQALVVSS
jgi:signal transduction histidine kinase